MGEFLHGTKMYQIGLIPVADLSSQTTVILAPALEAKGLPSKRFLGECDDASKSYWEDKCFRSPYNPQFVATTHHPTPLSQALCFLNPAPSPSPLSIPLSPPPLTPREWRPPTAARPGACRRAWCASGTSPRSASRTSPPSCPGSSVGSCPRSPGSTARQGSCTAADCHGMSKHKRGKRY